MVNLGTVQEDQTVRFMISTAAADGGREDFSASLEEADVVVVKDGSAMTLDASTITITMPFNSDTGIHEIAIDLSNDADFTTGSWYWVYVHPDETIDSQSVGGVVGCFRIESADEKAVRLLRQYIYPTDSTVSTTTNNSVTSINLTEIVDAQTSDLSGEVLAVHDATNDQVWLVRVTAFSYPQATVEALDGGDMPAAVAAGDHVWRVGQFTAMDGSVAAIASASTLSGVGDNVTGVADILTGITSLAEWLGIIAGKQAGDATALTELRATGAASGTVDPTTDSIEAIVDQLNTLISQALSFSSAGNVQADVQEINEATITGDGSATPFDVA